MIGYCIPNKNDFSEHARYTFRQMAKMIGVSMTEVHEIEDIPAQIDAVLVYGDQAPAVEVKAPLVFIAQSDYAVNISLTHHDVKILKSTRSELPVENVYFFLKEIDHLPQSLYDFASPS